MPGLRHISLLSFDGASDTQLDTIVEALRALPAQIPELVTYTIGRDAGIDEGNAALAVVADFADAADYPTYRDHPAHVKVGRELIRPILTGRTAIQHPL